jgi:hypothetical protein
LPTCRSNKRPWIHKNIAGGRDTKARIYLYLGMAEFQQIYHIIYISEPGLVSDSKKIKKKKPKMGLEVEIFTTTHQKPSLEFLASLT